MAMGKMNPLPDSEKADSVMRSFGRSGSHTLVWHLGRLALGILLPTLIFVAVLLWQLAASERARVEAEAQSLARGLATALDREVNGIEATLQALASSPALTSGDLAGFYAQAVDLQRETGMHVSLRSPAGETLLTTRAPFGVPVKTSPDLLDVDQEVLQTHLPAVSNVFIGAVIKRPAFQVVAPVLKNGSVVQLLGASFEPSELADALKQEGFGPDWLGAIVDRNGTFVVRTQDGERYVGKPSSSTFQSHATKQGGFYYGPNSDKVEMLVGFARSTMTGWSAAISTPAATVAAGLWRSVLLLVGLGALLAVVATVLALFSAGRISSAVRALRDSAAAIGRGEPVEPTATRLLELDEVGQALASVSTDLRARADERDRAEAALRASETHLRDANEQLEERVTQRTAELEASNRTLVAEMRGREEAESQLRQMQKMEAVGQLTGGIAHDFNNMLAVVIGGLNVISRRLKRGDHDVQRFIDAAIEGATRAATLTQRLLAFSRQQPLAPEPVDANKLVASMSDMLRQTLGSGVRLETVLSDGLWRTHADMSQLENALLNLAVNARDAMPDAQDGGTGRLTIETANTDLDETYARLNQGVRPGQYVMVAVSDNGSGMPAEVIAKAFDPFFTTKEVGKGTGLGLSQVYGFVKQSGGYVKIYSEPGEGTTIKIYLPRFHGEEESPIGEAAKPSLDLPQGNPRQIILVVEDEEALRLISVDGLRELGYTVRHADGGAAALRVLDSQPDVALLFTDIVMPDMNGRRLADEAQRRRPGLKVLFTTGFTRNAVVHNGMLDPGTNFLPKPFTLQQLAAKVREVLGE